MFWLQRKHLKAFLRNSLWVVPAVCMAAALVLAPLSRHWNAAIRFQFFGFGIEGARAVVSMIAASMLTFVVFFFSVLLVTVQIASASLSPRIIARPFQSPVLKTCLGLFVFTFIYGLAVLGRLEAKVPEMLLAITVILTIASIVAFLFVVEFVGKELRPATVVAKVARDTLKVIRSVYPEPWTGTLDAPPAKRGPVDRTIRREGHSGVVVAFNLDRLLAFAVENDSVVELVPQVGDFIATGAPLFRIYGRGGSVESADLPRAVMLGRERTLEQDPAFGFRIIVDIAEKALSAAINDPTTAVLAVDQIQALLQEVGERDLSTGAVCDRNGRVRVLYRTPNWEDFVSLAVTEIRHYGEGSVQIMRRLRSMLVSLVGALPPARTACLLQQLDLLRVEVERTFSDPRDRVSAEIADSQGLGAASSPGDGEQV